MSYDRRADISTEQSVGAATTWVERLSVKLQADLWDLTYNSTQTKTHFILTAAAALVFALSQLQHWPSTSPVHFQASLPTSWPSLLPHSSLAASHMSCPASCRLEVFGVIITLAGCLDLLACSSAMVCSMAHSMSWSCHVTQLNTAQYSHGWPDNAADLVGNSEDVGSNPANTQSKYNKQLYKIASHACW